MDADISQLPGLVLPLAPGDELVVYRGGNPVRIRFQAVADMTQSAEGGLVAASNLSDVPNKTTARTNLGLGSAAVLASTAFDPAGAAAAAVAGLGATAAGLALLTAADVAAQKVILGIV